jgi:hypothetical protein
MSEQILKNKNLLIGGGVVIALVLTFFVFFGSQESNVQGELMVDLNFSDPVEEILGRQVIVSLNQIKGIKIDTDFFKDSAFQSLQDFTVIIPKQNTGRRDPFAAIGSTGINR